MKKRAEQIAGWVRFALLEELSAYPKPGLVSFVDSGSHADLDAGCFVASIDALLPFFVLFANGGAAGGAFEELQKIGIEAEGAMLRATGGRNTHRGAIFCLGLLAAAAGLRLERGEREERSLGEIAAGEWGQSVPRVEAIGWVGAESHGVAMCRRYGVGGIREEARRGFPCVWEIGLPVYRDVEPRLGKDAAKIQAFYAMLLRCEDTTLLKRGGKEGETFAREKVEGFLNAGGVFQEGWAQEAQRIHSLFVAKNLTAGGVADLLAATIFVWKWEVEFLRNEEGGRERI